MRYQSPRSAYDSEEKRKRDEGQNYSKRRTLPPKVGDAVIRGHTVERELEQDGKTYTYEYTEHDAPIAKETFDRMTKGKYKTPRRT